MDKIGRWQLLAEQLFTENKPVFIKDDSDNFYFGNVILVGDSTITVDCFGPSQRKGERKYLRWLSITQFTEYEGGGNGSV